MQKQTDSNSNPTQNIAKEIDVPREVEDGLRVGADVIEPIVAVEADKGLRVLQWVDRRGEVIRREGTDFTRQMIMMTEIKKALAIQNSILKKQNEMLKKQEEEIDSLINKRKK